MFGGWCRGMLSRMSGRLARDDEVEQFPLLDRGLRLEERGGAPGQIAEPRAIVAV